MQFYKDEMEKVCSPNGKYVKEKKLLAEHKRVYTAAIDKFYSRKKFGYAEHTDEYRLKLEQQMDESFKLFESNNALNNKLDVIFF